MAPWTALVCSAALLSGCSFVMMNNPPQPPVTSQVHCESSMVVPVVDAIAAVAVVALGSTVMIGLAAEDVPPPPIAGVAGVSVGLGTLFVVSSITGVGRAKRCQRAIDSAGRSS